MRYILIFLLILTIISCKNGNEQKNSTENITIPAATESISPELLLMTDTILSKYYSLKNAFVEADSLNIDQTARTFSSSLNTFKNISSNDRSISNSVKNSFSFIIKNADSITYKSDIIHKRRSFSSISDTLFSILQKIQYSGQPVYQQICPMAFNDSEKAHWLSQYREIENPYLGKKHPKYGAGMLHCGELLDQVNFRR